MPLGALHEVAHADAWALECVVPNQIQIEHLGYLRERNIIPGLIPISRAAWWRGVAAGRYPAGVKLSDRVTAWRRSDIQALLQRLDSEAPRVGGAV